MSILSKSFKCNFTQVPNEIINDKNVSLKAKGLYLYMVSKPDNWEFSLNGLTSQLQESKPAILRILDELIKCGYLEKIKNRINGRQALNDYILHEKSCFSSEYQNETQKMRLSNCDSVNDTTSNTIKTNTKREIKNNSLVESKERDFKKFKIDFILNNKNILFYTQGLGWLPDTAFVINEDDYILNTVSQKILTADEAFKIWKYLFQNQKG
ncbi:MAG: helix-turn-helix domain-containing protein [Sulfurimonas sp.]|jgi:DNA-binding MarR family transcriptional regulator|uniref:helix-turn-helix domain-containing protein n=1 Tax=Sulfurimonas sp. TaxID=2022749 RepID=UPI001BB90C88|nr:hypothetical protein [Sulfurimonas sp.]MDX9756958.1 hypothetical protein [Sulfurimonas sp.]